MPEFYISHQKNSSSDTEIHSECSVGPQSEVNDLHYDAPISIGNASNIKRSTFGKFSACGNNCTIVDTKLGSFCSIGDNVITNAGEHPKNWLSTSLVHANFNYWRFSKKYSRVFDANNQGKYYWRKKVQIGSDVWIGSNVVILTGVDIAHGVIIGANTVVGKPPPPYSIVAGNPSKIIGFRFTPDIIDELLKSHWWDLDLDEILRLPITCIVSCLAIFNKK